MPRSTFTQPTPMTRFRVHWSRIFGSAAMGLLIGFLLCWGVTSATDHRLPPCKTEDSTHCYWDADTIGNHQGQDIVVP